MHLMYFTEQPMSAYPEEEGRTFGATALMFSNRFFDPAAGSRLYNEYLEHYRLAGGACFHRINLNRQHQAPLFLDDDIKIFRAVLQATQHRAETDLPRHPPPPDRHPAVLP